MFTTNAILFREIQCKKNGYFNVLTATLQCEFGWNKIKYARITISIIFVIALTLDGSLGRYLSTLLIGLVFKRLPPSKCYFYEKPCAIPIFYGCSFVVVLCSRISLAALKSISAYFFFVLCFCEHLWFSRKSMNFKLRTTYDNKNTAHNSTRVCAHPLPSRHTS